MLDQPPVREHPPFFGMPISSCKCSGLLFRSFSLSSTSSSPIHLLYIYFLPPHPHRSLYGMRTTIIVNEARTSTATLAPTTTKLKIERLRLHFALERATAPARSPSVPNVTRLRKNGTHPSQCCPRSPPNTSGQHEWERSTRVPHRTFNPREGMESCPGFDVPAKDKWEGLPRLPAQRRHGVEVQSRTSGSLPIFESPPRAVITLRFRRRTSGSHSVPPTSCQASSGL
jgi:hypothetical protein